MISLLKKDKVDNVQGLKKYIPKELDDAIYNSISNNRETWEITKHTGHFKNNNTKPFYLTKQIDGYSFQISETGHVLDWRLKIYWCYNVSEGLKQLVSGIISQYKKEQEIKNKLEDKSYLDNLISII